jgi:uncharacterized protein
MRTVDPKTRIEILDREECVRLLASQEVGRVVAVNHGRPHVVPVNYILDGDAIVFRTDVGTKLDAAGRSLVAFEVDDLHRENRSGWSVVVQGWAQELTAFEDPAVVARVAALPMQAWAEFEKPHVLRIVPHTITGRRVGAEASRSAAGGDELTVLSDARCTQLLRTHRFGRVAFAHEGWPTVLPVNYVFDDPDLLVRTGPGAKLDSIPLTAVAFEIDDADPGGTWGWSVLVQGPAFDITDADDDWSFRLRRLPVEPWAHGEKSHWLKVAASRISGRSFGVAASNGGVSDG